MKKFFTPLSVTITFAIAAIVSPLAFTLSARYKIFDFYDTGQIGDTIGGLTAPVIGLLNAILLYWTLKRQDDQIEMQKKQRIEDKFDVFFYRKSELIGSLIKSLELTVKFEGGPEFLKPLEPNGKNYKGENAILIARSLFSTDIDMLQYHKINELEWSSFMNTLSQIVVETTLVLNENRRKVSDIMDRKANYEYVTAHISYIPLLYNGMVNYKTTFPNDIGLKTFKIDEYLSFKHNVDMINLYDPAPDLKAPSTNQNMEQPPSPENA